MQLLPNGKQQFFTASGQPLANGKVFFYLPNTSTPATTYQDPSGQTPNANPVILDGNGQAIIYGTGSYRQVVQDANGQTIWDQTTTAPDSAFINLGQSGVGQGVDMVAGATKKVASIAALRALRVPQGSDAQTVIVDGYSAAGDGGGGVFQWWPNSSQVDDAGIYINPNGNSGAGRWVRADFHIFATVQANWWGVSAAATDNSVAISAALSYAMGGNRKLKFPSGTINFTQDNIFGATGFQQGLVFEGDGMFATVLNLVTNGAQKHFFNNTTGSQQRSFMTFMNMGFSTDNSTNGNFFSAQGDQGNSFIRCRFYNFNICFDLGGTVLSSENKFYHCKFNGIRDKAFRINNSQSLNTELWGCDIESNPGHIFYVDSGGGGDVKMYGGSVVLGDAGATYAPSCFLYLTGSANMGQGNGNFLFSGLRTEFYANTSLVNKAGNGGIVTVTFDKCNLTTVNGNTGQLANLNAQAHVSFVRCWMPYTLTYQLSNVGGYGGNFTEGGSLVFDECYVPYGFSDMFTITENGYARATNCVIWGGGGVNNNNRESPDFELNWQVRGGGDSVRRLKSAVIVPANGTWPYGTGNDWTVKLPANALIRNIYIYRPAAGGSFANYQLFVGNGDKSVTYGASGVTAQLYASKIIVEKTADALINVGTSANSRMVQVWADPANPGDTPMTVAGSYAVVEYY